MPTAGVERFSFVGNDIYHSRNFMGVLMRISPIRNTMLFRQNVGENKRATKKDSIMIDQVSFCQGQGSASGISGSPDQTARPLYFCKNAQKKVIKC